MVSIPSIRAARKHIQGHLRAAKGDPLGAADVMVFEIVLRCLDEYENIVSDVQERERRNIQIDRFIDQLLNGRGAS